jgi:hypothetical protein
MLKDLVGFDNGYFIVKGFVGYKYYSTGKSRRLWECICRCSNIVQLTTENIRKCIPRSCGCYKQRIVPRVNNDNLIVHGFAKRNNGKQHPLYVKWVSIRQRCFNDNNKSYKWYGAKGITVCDLWKDFKMFFDWCLRNNWEKGLVIDRIDPLGNYSPDNCRFITHSENSKRVIYNKTNTQQNGSAG